MKAVVAAFNQEKALVGAFSVITNLRMELFQALVSMSTICCPDLFYGFPVYFQGFMFFLQQQLAAGLGPGVSGVLSRPDQRRFCGENSRVADSW